MDLFSAKKILYQLLLFGTAILYSCDSFIPVPEPDPDENTPASGQQYSFGWRASDNLSTVPVTTNFGFSMSTNLPTAVDLTPKFPPIGDQGNYGTCVAWAVGYYAKTAISGIDNRLSSSQLASAANQTSPKDLFLAIPDNKKGSLQNLCDGTNFSDAFDLLQQRGAAKMRTVPYTNLGSCSRNIIQSNWTNEAGNNKIKYWRKINPTIQNIKQNLANNIPVILGARLADNFIGWNSSNVITSNTSFNEVGLHAFHALVIVGYDDRKGPRGAFRVINSWGPQWGDRGFIWIDYNFLVQEFCNDSRGGKPLFIMANDNGSNVPDNTPNPPASSGVDLASWVFSDVTNFQRTGNPNERNITFNIYNIGSQAAIASAEWSVYYIYFNAYNANDYGVLFYDEFNRSAPLGGFRCPTNYNCIFNVTIPPGNNFAKVIFNSQNIARTYYMPNISGSYYLVMIVDAYDDFREQDEVNNFFYTTTNPKFFQNGYSNIVEGIADGDSDQVNAVSFSFQNEESSLKLSQDKHPFASVVNSKFPNAYTTEEIGALIREEKRNGRLQEKIHDFIRRQKGSAYNK